MQSLVFPSKLSLPANHRPVVPRERLTAKMADFGGRLLLLYGGAGYGKTELARQYAKGFEGRVLWYTMDAEDNDVAVFAAHLARLAATEFSLCDGGSDFARVLYGICHAVELEANSGGHCLFVFDAVENITENTVLNCLRRFVANVPDGAQVLITSRGCPPDVLARFVVDGSGMVFGGRQLLFDRHERMILADLTMKAQPEAARIYTTDLFEHMLGGWPAAEALAFSYFNNRPVPEEETDWADFLRQSLLAGFFQSEVFSAFSKDEREFMLKTAGLTALDTDVCTAILGEEVAEMVRRLEDADILSGEAGVLRYNDMFKRFLLLKGGAAARNEVCRRAADFFLKRRDYARAAEQAKASGCADIAAKILEQAGELLFEQDENGVIEQCVVCLERDEAVFGRARVIPAEALGIAAQFCYKNGDTAKAEAYFNRADSCFGKENKFSMYRGLYRGLLRYEQDEEKYGRIVSNALFMLSENGFALPYLKNGEKNLLERIAQRNAGQHRRLTVDFFGEFRITMPGGKLMSWRTRKSAELFACLAELGGQAIGRGKLLSVLWNDEMPDNAVAMLHNMIYNIRKELAEYDMTDIIRYKDKMYSVNIESINTNLAEINGLCKLVEGEREFLLPWKSAFQTYWGKYLEDIDSPWVIVRREYYDTVFLKGCSVLADDALGKGDYGQASVFLKNAMAVNPYDEDIEGKLLKCYGAMRSLKLAKTEYERFSNLLQKDLGLCPGRELEKTYRDVMSR